MPMDVASWLRLCAAMLAGCVFSVLPLFQLLQRAASGALSLNFCPLRAAARAFPARMASPRWGRHCAATVNGLRMHYLERSPSDGGGGGGAAARPPLMLCLHGFPECAYSWRWLLASFSSTYRVVAPDLRGFGQTSRSEGSASWWSARDARLQVLVADVVALLAALGETECVLVGHDWGAVVAYAVATAHPAAVRRLVILNGPHPAAMYDALSPAQLLRSFYIFVFQLPLLPEAWLRAGRDGVGGFLRGAMLGGRRGPGAMGVRRRGEPLALDAADVDCFAWALDGAGSLTAAINWYRCIFSHNAAYHAEIGMEAPASIRAPLLNVWGEDDSALGGRAMADAAARYAQPGAFTLALVPRCSHWTQQDAVLETLHAVAAFLGMRVPAAMRPPPDAYAVSGAPLPTPAADAPMLHNVLEFAGE
jgi:pimeloyl-ACP methyl ester carboxylesterase